MVIWWLFLFYIWIVSSFEKMRWVTTEPRLKSDVAQQDDTLARTWADSFIRETCFLQNENQYHRVKEVNTNEMHKALWFTPWPPPHQNKTKQIHFTDKWQSSFTHSSVCRGDIELCGLLSSAEEGAAQHRGQWALLTGRQAVFSHLHSAVVTCLRGSEKSVDWSALVGVNNGGRSSDGFTWVTELFHLTFKQLSLRSLFFLRDIVPMCKFVANFVDIIFVSFSVGIYTEDRRTVLVMLKHLLPMQGGKKLN